MHAEAMEAVINMATRVSDTIYTALDIGGRDNNGNARSIWPDTKWTVLDTEPGDDVDIVDDARLWRGNETHTGHFDLVLCTEVLEHCEGWAALLTTAHWALRPGGWLVLTAASHLRPPHGATGDPLPAEDEWYKGVHPEVLHTAAQIFDDVEVKHRPIPGDVYLLARRPRL